MLVKIVQLNNSDKGPCCFTLGFIILGLLSNDLLSSFFCKSLFLLLCKAINETAYIKPININPIKKKGNRTINHAIFLPYLN